MIYYTWFHGHGCRSLADEFGVDDPLGLEPGEIVDRIVAAGYIPRIEAPQSWLLPMPGTKTEVEREGLTYLVSISRDVEAIDVQERRVDAFERVE